MQFKVRLWVKIVLALSLICVFAYYYGRYYETTGLNIKEYNIKSKNIPSNFYGFKIVHITDIHYNVTTDKYELKKIVDEINKLEPDVVVFTGDLFDKDIKYSNKDLDNLVEILSEIKATNSKFYVSGDQDDKEKISYVFDKCNFIDLNNSHKFIFNEDNEPILFIGINDIKELGNIYQNLEFNYNYSILLTHKPDIVKKIDYSKFNLILAGHSLNGQINLPFAGGMMKFKGSKYYYKPYYKLNNTKLFISGGIGTTKYKFRFLNKPSINLYRLLKK